MRNLLFFLYKYYTFLLFFSLELFSLIILYQYNTYQRASFLNTTGAIAASFYEKVNNTTSYFSLRRINDSLLTENARLRTLQLNAYYQNGFTLSTLNDTNYKQQYSYISANVVNNSVIRRNNYITIDKGRLHGIEPNMGVISSNGVVGIVTAVSEHFSTIRSALNKDTKISAMLKKNGAFGSLEWKGDNPKYTNLVDVNKHVQVKVGDEVITNNFSTIFPVGIPVGVISEQSLDAGDNFHTLKVELYTDFSTLRNVYVIRNKFRDEQVDLERQVKGDH